MEKTVSSDCFTSRTFEWAGTVIGTDLPRKLICRVTNDSETGEG